MTRGVRSAGRAAHSRAAVRLALALILVHCAGAYAASTPDLGAFTRTLDALVARARPDGGWTFESAPGERPRPFTLVMQVAERVARPLGLARWDLLVMRSPGTPAAGLLLVAGHRLTGRADYLDAARRAGDLLVAAQLASGGWFSEMPVEGGAVSPWFRWIALRTTLDDDVTPGAVRFLLTLWEATGDARYRAAAERAIDLLLVAQLPGGAWPHVWRPAWLRAVHASREDQPSLNDGVTPLIIETLLEAARALGRPALVSPAKRAGTWLRAVQRRPPRAGWAQQYDDSGLPAGMRRFEAPALATWESRHAIDALDALARATGDTRWCGPAHAAARWLRDVGRTGCWARFIDLVDGTSIYLDADGARVATVAQARAGYDWQGDFGIPALLRRLDGGSVSAPPAPLPGDPGACPGLPDPLHAGQGARGLIARAGTELATIAPPPASRCAEPALVVVAAGGLR